MGGEEGGLEGDPGLGLILAGDDEPGDNDGEFGLLGGEDGGDEGFKELDFEDGLNKDLELDEGLIEVDELNILDKLLLMLDEVEVDLEALDNDETVDEVGDTTLRDEDLKKLNEDADIVEARGVIFIL